ncbi:MAG TPA: hypothetical protein VF209_00155 [Patescibacteria group bacterium]
MADLPTGQANYTAYSYDLTQPKVFGPQSRAQEWFAKPFLKSLLTPYLERVSFKVKKKRATKKKIIILNCHDYLYGHTLLKLLNAYRHLHHDSSYDLVVIVPPFLEWLVPAGVAEIWVVDLPLSKTLHYYPFLEQKIKTELRRFKEVELSPAYSHPVDFKIEEYTRVKPYMATPSAPRITFIWREDRPWFFSFPISYIARKLKLLYPLVWWQNVKIRRLFSLLKKQLPEYTFTVAGLGTSTAFPKWIDDQRVESFTPSREKKLCQVYANSQLVIGVHGSSMLLPTAHSHMFIDLLPSDRVGNFAQDVLFQLKPEDSDPRLQAFKYRFLPISLSVAEVAQLSLSMVRDYPKAVQYFINP